MILLKIGNGRLVGELLNLMTVEVRELFDGTFVSTTDSIHLLVCCSTA